MRFLLSFGTVEHISCLFLRVRCNPYEAVSCVGGRIPAITLKARALNGHCRPQGPAGASSPSGKRPWIGSEYRSVRADNPTTCIQHKLNTFVP